MGNSVGRVGLFQLLPYLYLLYYIPKLFEYFQ